MKITIKCPECKGLLTDWYGADNCMLMFGEFSLSLECNRCDAEFKNVSVTIAKHPEKEERHVQEAD